MLYEFKLKSNAIVATESIRATYGRKTLSVTKCYSWFTRFRSDDCSLDDLLKSGRAVELDNDVLPSFIEFDSCQTIEDLSQTLGCCWVIVQRHNQQMDPKWIDRIAKKANRMTVWNSLLMRHKQEPILKQIIASDEKWILYVNRQQRNLDCILKRIFFVFDGIWQE